MHEATINIRRNVLMVAASVCNVALSLIVLGGFVLVVANLQRQAQGLVQQGTITVDLEDSADENALQKQIFSDRRVLRAPFRSKEENLRATCRKYNLPYAELSNAMDNPLPDCFLVSVERPEDIRDVAESLKKLPGVQEVRYGAQVMEKLLVITGVIKKTGLALSILLVFASLAIVHSTIRLTIHARRREIRIMQLVGATNNFIRLPFLLEGVFCGFFGGLIASLVLLLCYTYASAYVDTHLQFLDLVQGPELLAMFGFGVVLSGVLFGIAGSTISLQRYLQTV